MVLLSAQNNYTDNQVEKMHTIDVQIVYALQEKAWVKNLTIPRGSTPDDAIKLSGILEEIEELRLMELDFGIFSKKVDQFYLMNNGDRLEIYRQLTADPKTVRRELAKAGKTMSGDR